jgi:hypothetical protein
MVHSPNKKGNCIVPIGCWAVRRLRNLIFIWLVVEPYPSEKYESQFRLVFSMEK